MVRYLIKFTKGCDIKFISHLDLMRTLQRIISRSKLKVEYSKGFNPRINMSICQPLSVGVCSSSEYLDTYFEDDLIPEVVLETLNKAASSGIEFIYAVKVKDNLKSFMALLAAARYNIKIKYTENDKLKEGLKNLSTLDEWNIIKKSKSSEKKVNIKPFVFKAEHKIENNILYIETILAAGSRDNLSPELFSKFIIENTEGYIENSFISIERTEMFAEENEKLIPLIEYCR